MSKVLVARDTFHIFYNSRGGARVSMTLLSPLANAECKVNDKIILVLFLSVTVYAVLLGDCVSQCKLMVLPNGDPCGLCVAVSIACLRLIILLIMLFLTPQFQAVTSSHNIGFVCRIQMKVTDGAPLINLKHFAITWKHDRVV